MLVQYGPTPEISITYDPATRCYGFSTRLPGMRPHWTIDTFESLQAVMRWADPWRERVWGRARQCGRRPDIGIAEQEAGSEFFPASQEFHALWCPGASIGPMGIGEFAEWEFAELDRH